MDLPLAYNPAKRSGGITPGRTMPLRVEYTAFLPGGSVDLAYRREFGVAVDRFLATSEALCSADRHIAEDVARIDAVDGR